MEVSYRNRNLQGMNFSNRDLSYYDFSGADLTGADFRNSNLTGAHIEGANLHFANLEGAILKDIHFDAATKYFRMRCPEKGPFLGYKLCYNFRVVRLLIPADAKRCSATSEACRCNKAKVLSIQSVDQKVNFQEAEAFVDHRFIYRVGEMVHVKNFNEDRWTDSTTGIHFFMSREEAISYMKS